jgi:glycosyltransferase involved in cell wall biosynthesis
MEHKKKITFVWLGDGYLPDSDVAYSVYLRDQINRSDLRDTVEILDAVADPEPIYSSADLFLLSSRLDPLPNVAIEAAMRALPVVCFDGASGIAELLAQNQATRDLVVPYLDCDAAARLVNQLAEDPVRLVDCQTKSIDSPTRCSTWIVTWTRLIIWPPRFCYAII